MTDRGDNRVTFPAFTAEEMNEFARDALIEALEIERMECVERIAAIDRQFMEWGHSV